MQVLSLESDNRGASRIIYSELGSITLWPYRIRIINTAKEETLLAITPKTENNLVTEKHLEPTLQMECFQEHLRAKTKQFKVMYKSKLKKFLVLT